jgi:mannose-6-phosphate isomerase
VKPAVLPPNVLRHFYEGGPRIAAFRGLDLSSDHMPEEWIGAVNTTFGDETRGLSRLEDGTYLRDAIAADPEAYLGPDHVARWGADTGLLVKLLDAGQRLPVHFHPGRAFAGEALGLAHGKTEAWIILEAEEGASVHAGFAEDVDLDTVRGWMRDQDSAAMLAAMRELPIAAGDALFIPAGTPHAIGAGMLLVELQEPTDLSALLEWNGFELTEDEAHLDLGWDRVLQALDTSGWDDERLATLTATGEGAERRGEAGAELARQTPGRILGPDADPYFRAERVRGGDALDAGFSILVGTEGSGRLVTEGGGEQPFARGDAVLVPHAAGAGELRGDVVALRSRPADPGSQDGRW